MLDHIRVLDIDHDNDNINNHSGTTLRASVAPVDNSASGCTPSRDWIRIIGDDGQVLPSLDISLLIRSPKGNTHCRYDVRFPTASQSGALTLVSAESAVIAIDRMSAAADYANVETVFSPVVDIAVVDLDDDQDGRNDFSGTTLTVSFVPRFEFRCRVRQRSW